MGKRECSLKEKNGWLKRFHGGWCDGFLWGKLLQKYENIVGNNQQIKTVLKDNEQFFENKQHNNRNIHNFQKPNNNKRKHNNTHKKQKIINEPVEDYE